MIKTHPNYPDRKDHPGRRKSHGITLGSKDVTWENYVNERINADSIIHLKRSNNSTTQKRT